MKASEIFLNYAEPVCSHVPEDISVEELEELLKIPYLVWNAVNLDENLHRKPGQLPAMLRANLQKAPPKIRKFLESNLEMWTRRKDNLFPQHQWLMLLEIYKNVKKQVIIRVEVRKTDNLDLGGVPPEWLEPKLDAKVTRLYPK